MIVLTKADLAPTPELRVAEVEAIAFGVPVHAVSSVTGEGSTTCAESCRPASRARCSAHRASASRRS